MTEWFYRGIFGMLLGGCFLTLPQALGQGTLIVPFGGVKEMGPGHSTPPLPYEKNYIMLPMTSGKVMLSDGGQQIIVRKPVPLHSRRKTVIPLDQIQGQVSPTPVVPRGFNGGNVAHYSSSTSISPIPSCPASTFVTEGAAVSPSMRSPTPAEISPAPAYSTDETASVSPSSPSHSVPSPAPSILVPSSEATMEVPYSYKPVEELSPIVRESTSESTRTRPLPSPGEASSPDFSGANEETLSTETTSPSSATFKEAPESPSENASEPDPYLPMNFSSPSPSPIASESPDTIPNPSENASGAGSSSSEAPPTLTESTSIQMEARSSETKAPAIFSEQPTLDGQKRDLPPVVGQAPTSKRGGNSIYNTPAISTYRENGEILTRRANIMDYYQNVTPIQVPKQGGAVRMGASPTVSPSPSAEPLPNALPGSKPASIPVSPDSSQAGRKV